jgi:hypothetical protein
MECEATKSLLALSVYSSTMKTEAISFSETSSNVFQTFHVGSVVDKVTLGQVSPLSLASPANFYSTKSSIFSHQ